MGGGEGREREREGRYVSVGCGTRRDKDQMLLRKPMTLHPHRYHTNCKQEPFPVQQWITCPPKKSILLIKSTHTVTGRIQKERKEELQCHVYGCQLMTFAMKNELSSCHCMPLYQATYPPSMVHGCNAQQQTE